MVALTTQQEMVGAKRYCIVYHCPRPYDGLNVNDNITSANREQEELVNFNFIF